MFKPKHRQAFCRDHEGWGPISNERDFDLTPCFEEAVLIPVPLILLLVGSVFVTLRLKRVEAAQRTARSKAILLTKMILLGIAAAASEIVVLDKALLRKTASFYDQHLYASNLQTVALLLSIPLTYFNHTRTRRSSTLLLAFWPLYLLTSAIWLRTAVATHLYHRHLFEFVARCITLGTGASAFFFECYGPEIGDKEEHIASDGTRESPYVTANIYSRLFFLWMTPMMRLGYSRFITHEDMYSLLPQDSTEKLGERLQHYWDLELKKKKPSLWLALIRAYGGPFAVAGGLKVIYDLLQFLQPQLLRLLLAFIAKYQHEKGVSPLGGFAISFLMFFASSLQTAIVHQYFQRCFETGMRVRAGLVATIYKKALVLSNDRSATRGDIVNLMSVDSTRMQDLCTYILIMISGPFQVFLAFTSLYQILGPPAIVGVVIMFICVPLNTSIARYQKRLQEKQMKNRDKRTRLMSELLTNIRSIKLYAWEGSFMQKILTVRNDFELKMLRKIGVATAVGNIFWSSVPLLVAFASFATAAKFGDKPLTSDVIFPCMSLFLLLQFPLAMFSMITSSFVQALVAVNRLTKFLESEELQKDAKSVVPIIPGERLKIGDTVVSIKDGEFKWSSQAIESTLEGINVEVKKGELVGIVGRVGSGKTSLLSAILGEMHKSEGKVTLQGSIAYAPQNPWIMSATVRENITFFHKFDEEYYERVLDACALRPDLKLLAEGDMTQVGERGISLSGGQRARIALARCVYARAEINLLDDVLAALDAHVARHIFDHVIGPQGLLAHRARILVTNSISYLKKHDQLWLVRRGIILEAGAPDEFMSNSGSEMYKLLNGLRTFNVSTSNSGSATPATLVGELENIEPVEQDASGGETSDSIESELDIKKTREWMDLEPAPLLTSQERREQLILSTNPKAPNKEQMEQGQVKRRVYIKYLEAASKFGVAVFVFCTFAQQIMTILSNLTLSAWGENNRDDGDNSGSMPYLIAYGMFVLSAMLLSGAASIFLWVYCAIRSGRALHDAMLASVLRAPLSWFEQTPQGRVLNLFSRDQYVVDQVLVQVFSGFFRTTANVSGIVIVLGYSFPIFLLFLIPMGFIYRGFMKYYLATSRELKRIEAVTRSPIFAWFQESLSGLETARAYGLPSVFVSINEQRSDNNLECYMPSINTNRWLAVRLELMGAIIVLLSALMGVVTLVVTGNVNSGLVGVVLSYALSTTGSLNWVVRSASEVEQNIVSVERILQYVSLASEAPAEIPDKKPVASWPQRGEITFDSYSMRYRPELDLVLKDISLDIKPGERIGICGRTGAGKSSLLLALLRVMEPAEGSIIIDGVDVTKIGLTDLRSAISIIPQEPQLFEGTIRENLDPTGIHEDSAIWNALEQAKLKDFISETGGLDTLVKEGGSSMSAGQRQLVCFARALLRKTKILVCDEATSTLDMETDRAIQEIMSGPQFEGVTVLTIAHRLDTIMNSHRILVLDAGRIAEFDQPETLLDRPDSIFLSLATEAGILSK